MKRAFSTSLLIILLNLSSTQSQNIDSLKQVLDLHKKEDTIRVKMLYDWGEAKWNDDHGKSFSAIEDGIHLSDRLNWKRGQVLGLISILRFKTYDHKFDEALTAGLASLKIIEQINDTVLMANAAFRMGELYRSLNNDSLAVFYSKKYFELAKITNDKKMILKAHMQLANLYSEMDKWTESAEHYDEGLKLALEQKDEYAQCIILEIKARRLQNLKNFSEAKKYFLQILSMWEHQNNHVWIAYTNMELSMVSSDLNHRDSAFYYANAALNLAKKYSLRKELGDAYSAFYYMSVKFHDYKNALNYYHIRDSLLKESYSMIAAQNMAITKAKYEQEKKDAEAKAKQDQKDIKQRNLRNSIATGLAGALVFLFILFRQRNKISREKKRSDELLLNILPEETAEELKQTGSARAKSYDVVTVMFTDFKDFTRVAEKLSAEELVKEINYCYSEFDKIISKYNIEKIKTIGDSYMCAGGLPVPNQTNAEDILKAAIEIRNFMTTYAISSLATSGTAFGIRIGIHSGPVTAGIVGIKKFAYDIWGDTVNIASRMESSGEAGKVNISGVTYNLVKDKFICTYRGKIQAKNKGEIDMYFVESKL